VNKKSMLRMINLLLFFNFILVATSGLWHELISHNLYEKLHVIPGFSLIALVVAHLVLNAGWIKQIFSPPS